MNVKDKRKSLIERGVFLFFGDVDEQIVEDAVEFILEENIYKTNEELTLVVNSRGGSVDDGMALIDVMAGSKIPVKTVGVGCLASMGLSIFIAGEKGSRVLTPNTSIMAHQWTWGYWGKEHELLAMDKHNKLTQRKMIRHYQKHTGLSEQEIREFIFPPHDAWLSAKEAKKLGLCDVVRDL